MVEAKLGAPTRRFWSRTLVLRVPVHDVERAYEAVTDFNAFLRISGIVHKGGSLRLTSGNPGVEGACYFTSHSHLDFGVLLGEYSQYLYCESCTKEEIILTSEAEEVVFKRYTISIGKESNKKGNPIVKIRVDRAPHLSCLKYCQILCVLIPLSIYLHLMFTATFGLAIFLFTNIRLIVQSGKLEIPRSHSLKDLQFYFTTYSPRQPANLNIYEENTEILSGESVNEANCTDNQEIESVVTKVLVDTANNT